MVRKTPRLLRPFSIVVLNQQQEDNWCEVTMLTEVKWVSVTSLHTSRSLGMTGASDNKSILVTIDLNDYESNREYRDPDSYTDPNTQFTIRKGDKLLYNTSEYEVMEISELRGIQGWPLLLEVTAQ